MLLLAHLFSWMPYCAPLFPCSLEYCRYWYWCSCEVVCIRSGVHDLRFLCWVGSCCVWLTWWEIFLSFLIFMCLVSRDGVLHWWWSADIAESLWGPPRRADGKVLLCRNDPGDWLCSPAGLSTSRHQARQSPSRSSRSPSFGRLWLVSPAGWERQGQLAGCRGYTWLHLTWDSTCYGGW